jgi:hypothetical protein
MTSTGSCPQPETLISFLYDEFEAGSSPTRSEVAQHLRVCDACAREVEALGDTREHLSAWGAPEPELGFRMIRQPARRRFWPAWTIPALPMAAAAVLVLGAALGLARLDVRYGADGLQVRTGWGHAPEPPRVAGAASIGTRPGATTTHAGSRTSWEAGLAALRAEMHRELDAVRRGTATGSFAATTDARDATDPADAAWLRRVRQLIDQSEVRQQQNLALRIAELSKDFELRRNADLVHIEQGFGRLAGQRELDAEQQRLLLNAIRVSQQQPR